MTKRFEGKVAVITGGSTGIGAAAARQFAQEGAAVVLAARSAGPLEALAAEIEVAGGRAMAAPCDVSEIEAGRRLLEQAAERFGSIDILVNNAGANKRGPIEQYTAEELAGIVQINLVTPIALSRMVLPYMRRRGGGAIVNVASIAGRIPVLHEAVYSATKFGLRAFGFALHEELAEANITVSAVSPGPVDTGFIMEDIDHVPDVVFAQPMSTAEEIGSLVVECAADGAVERVMPQVTGLLANLGYLFPAVQKLVQPIMDSRGRAAKEEFKRRKGHTA